MNPAPPEVNDAPEVDQVSSFTQALAALGAEQNEIDVKGAPVALVIIAAFSDDTLYTVATGPMASPETTAKLIGVAGLKAAKDAGLATEPPRVLVPYGVDIRG